LFVELSVSGTKLTLLMKKTRFNPNFIFIQNVDNKESYALIKKQKMNSFISKTNYRPIEQ